MVKGKPFSAEWWQTKPFWLEIFHSLKYNCCFFGEIFAQVFIWNHDHLHPSCQRCFDPIGSIFKYKTLNEKEKKRW